MFDQLRNRLGVWRCHQCLWFFVAHCGPEQFVYKKFIWSLCQSQITSFPWKLYCNSRPDYYNSQGRTQEQTEEYSSFLNNTGWTTYRWWWSTAPCLEFLPFTHTPLQAANTHAQGLSHPKSKVNINSRVSTRRNTRLQSRAFTNTSYSILQRRVVLLHYESASSDYTEQT